MCRARVVHECPQETLSNRTATPCDALSLPRGLSGEQVSCQSLPCARLSRRDTERITSRVMEVLDTWTDNVSCKSRRPQEQRTAAPCDALSLPRGLLVNRSLVRGSLARVSLGRDTERITSRVMELLDAWTDNVSCKSRARMSSRDSL